MTGPADISPKDVLDILKSWREAGGLLWTSNGSHSSTAICAEAEARMAQWRGLDGREVELTHGALPETLAAIAALSRLGARVHLLPQPAGKTAASEPVVTIAEAVAVEAGGEVVIYTSGSTGLPKPKIWSWRTLLTSAHRGLARRAEAVATTYRLDSFAGIQALIHGLACARHFVPLGPGLEAPAALAECDFQILATPTFWRTALVTGSAAQWAQRRVSLISMGGEPVDQKLLNDVGELFADARIVHVYASTELGSLFAVSDRREGFPADWLEKQIASGVALGLRDGELVVSRGGRVTGTGDRFRISGDRVLFCGRLDETINVAGSKVDPHNVERVLSEVAGIELLRVFGLRSEIVGNAVAVDVVLRPGDTKERVREALLVQARKRLANHERPRLIRFVDSLPLTRTGKVLRKSQPAEAEFGRN
jgi:acyl-CoA synthetase (AMP-forming)/AMP-acid ligase II